MNKQTNKNNFTDSLRKQGKHEGMKVLGSIVPQNTPCCSVHPAVSWTRTFSSFILSAGSLGAWQPVSLPFTQVSS